MGEEPIPRVTCEQENSTSEASEANMREWAERWLSPSRLHPYVAASNEDIKLALALYRWNTRLGEVLMGDVSHFEVALRNAYDRVLCERWQGNDHWLLDDQSPVRRPITRQSKSKKPMDVNYANRKAIEQAQGRSHDARNPDQVLSNLMLGFWSHLTDRSRERELWIPHLHTAWPKGTNRARLQQSLHAINKVRNRVAHNERLFNPAKDIYLPTAVDAEILRLLRALCPEAAEYLYGDYRETPVELFLKEHPAPAKVAL